MKEYRRIVISGVGEDLLNPVNALAEDGWVVIKVMPLSGAEVYVLERDVQMQAPRARATKPLKLETK